ncbi:hypothetical protein LMB76_04090 [Limosilactobacillus reuteri]|uniref:Uncharacterized protein n=1 Tax=Limosilactobacillus reuteri TaxID=1598 RepID=A0AAW4X4R3_LIMRT|nr:hypothetical protein [Limosilactobacillus reuteri]MCC4477399.1 hypothetical protein [Limosilactobacillus reuteri]MCC4479676.1 hypothetical protein [Limosilactobacillus reuteri]MCC4489018.1 hypothetical protein [Limosilactobacillus reuteri]MCC4493283.1 hypothetical protein [Limosilactobacillus reuteri]MCC4496045.1 hypothetical protein [Limosilactobacillus reuteri]
MNKNSVIKVLGVLLIIAVANWYVDSQKLHDAQNQIRTEQTAKSKAAAQVEDLSATNDDLTDQNKELKDSQTHIKDGQQIKNDKFTIDYEDDGDGDYTLTVYPNKKNEKMIAQQGDGAQGLEIVNVPKTDKRTTMAN